MALLRVWAPGAESPTFLQDDMGHTFAFPANALVSSSRGSKTFNGRTYYAINPGSNTNNWWRPPQWQQNVGQGRVTILFWAEPGTVLGGSIELIRIFSNATNSLGAAIRTNISGSGFEMVVYNATVVSFPPFDYNVPHFITLEWDLVSGVTGGQTTHSARCYLDGVLVGTGWYSVVRNGSQELPFTTNTLTFYNLQAGTTNRTWIQQMVLWNDISGVQPGDTQIVSLGYPSTDGVNNGFGTSTEVNDFSAINNQPMDLAKYVEEPTPGSGDYVQQLTGGALSGITGSNGVISGITLDTWSTGDNNFAKAGIGDGSVSPNIYGSPILIDATALSNAWVTSEARPDASAFGPSDTDIELYYELN